MIEFPTLKFMRDQIARQIADTSASRATKIDEWINSHYSQMARKHAWPQLLRSSEAKMNLVAGSLYTYLPKEVEALFFVMPQNNAAAVNMAFDAILRNAATQFQTTGVPFAWAEAGEFGRRAEFYASAETLTLTQTGTSGAVGAVVHGTITSTSPNVGAQEYREELSISPSTGVVSTQSYTDLHSVGVETLGNNIITVTGTTSGTVYATIGIGENTARYKRIRLMQPDQAADLVTLIWKKRPFRLVSDNQAIEIPVGQALMDATAATMSVNQREFQAATYYEGLARESRDNALDASTQQGEQIYLGQPTRQIRGRRIIVNNP